MGNSDFVALSLAGVTVVVCVMVWFLWRKLANVDHRVRQLRDQVYSLERRSTMLQREPSAPHRSPRQDERRSVQSGNPGNARPSVGYTMGVAGAFSSLSPRSVHESVESAPTEPPAEPQRFSRDLVMDLYQKWCRDAFRPTPNSEIEIRPVRYVRQEEGSEFGSGGRHLLADSAQPAEFVRFSASGSREALVLPNPDAFFSPAMAYLFAGLSKEQQSNPEFLALLEPVQMRRRSDNEWELV